MDEKALGLIRKRLIRCVEDIDIALGGTRTPNQRTTKNGPGEVLLDLISVCSTYPLNTPLYPKKLIDEKMPDKTPTSISSMVARHPEVFNRVHGAVFILKETWWNEHRPKDDPAVAPTPASSPKSGAQTHNSSP